jgi:ectoine hydroxylase-related dioxygenase (phytanoyl-CoA dioxygenase family)
LAASQTAAPCTRAFNLKLNYYLPPFMPHNQNNIPDHNLPASSETGSTGIVHLKRFWNKALAGTNLNGLYPEESILDNTLIDILGTGLLPTYRFLYEQRPDFESFEKWVRENSTAGINSETIDRCHALINNKNRVNDPISANVLTKADLAFWEEHGYVIVRDAVSKEACAASRKAILDLLQMDEQDAASWYRPSSEIEGIMVNLYNQEAINKNRYAPRIRRAFEQLWNRNDLLVTSDKCGFNPPETATYKYRGIGLHWDVSLAAPIPFGTQGVLYLTDTAANQGALTVVPGFHKQLESWIGSLPAGTHPRQTDLSAFGPMPIAANAGDLIIWNHKLPHGASPNRAATPRIVQYINWYGPMEEVQAAWL